MTDTQCLTSFEKNKNKNNYDDKDAKNYWSDQAILNGARKNAPGKIVPRKFTPWK